MRPYRAFVLLAPALAWLAACGPGNPPAPEPAQESKADAASGNAPWFICDGIDSPTIFSATKSGDATEALVTVYDKATGLPSLRAEYDVGAPEGAAGNVETSFLREGEMVGGVRAINPGMLEQPGSAYTPPITSARVGEQSLSCRWLPRTRFAGFSERRSWVVYEDQDGDLIYASFDFLDPHRAEAIDLSGNGRSTPFSLEVRGGTETVGPDGAHFRFANGGFEYQIDAPNDAPGTVTVKQGAALVQSETLLAWVLGQAAAQ